jgi:hypothetical protein
MAPVLLFIAEIKSLSIGEEIGRQADAGHAADPNPAANAAITASLFNCFMPLDPLLFRPPPNQDTRPEAQKFRAFESF